MMETSMRIGARWAGTIIVIRNYALIVMILALGGIFVITRDAQADDKPVVIASFSTSIDGQDENVKQNIMIACSKIDGIVISPRSLISFNEIVGEGSAKNGFAPGRVLYRDQVVMEPGGGLCQVSSTLYNALLMAGCVIVERHRHFQPVTYVPLGLDATIKYGKKDLRMRNPHAVSLRIELRADDASLRAVVSAERKIPHRYEIATEEEEVPLPSAGEMDRIRPGMMVHVYRKRYRGDVLQENSLLYRDYYQPAYIR
ncbi:MAG: hypothetical protein E4G96_00475 [Chrysiogenales bacterium]|nr:MAG: hypothetical protein E4G96_00475 [Chrysiogenales bacterium]